MAASPTSPTALTHNANAFVSHVSAMVPNQLASGSQSLAPHQIFTTDASVRAWQAHLQTLSPEARTLFQRFATGSLDEYTKYVLETSKKHKKASRLRRVNDLFQPFFHTLNMYAPIAASAAQADPYPSSLVIGGIMCLLQISENFSEYQELLSKWLSKLTNKVSLLMDFDICIYQHDGRVQDVLAKIYGDVLQFCQKALNLFQDEQANRRGGFKMFSKSLKERFRDTFGEIIENFESHLEEYRDIANLCDAQRLKQFYMLQVDEVLRQRQFRHELRQFNQTQQLLNEEQRRHHEDERLLHQEIRQHQHDQLAFRGVFHQAYDNLSSSIADSRSAAHAAEAQRRLELDRTRLEEALRRREEKRRRVIEWLPSVAFKDEHDRRCKIREKGTGLWLFDDDDYQFWKASLTSSLLWVKGKAGCGKSVLSASTLSQLQDAKALEIAVAYFYCMSKDLSTSSPSMLLSTILKQLCLQHPEIEPELEALYDKNSLTENKGPRDNDLVRILPLVLARFTESFIIIDGLDECAEPKLILESLRSLIKDTRLRVKVIVFSRPGYVPIENALKDSLQLRVDRGGNRDDIIAFIASKLSTDEFDWNADEKLLETVKDKMLLRSENMFLYVNLQAGTLKGPLTQAQVLDRLAALPKGLDNTYKAALQRIIDNDDKERRDLALRILIWVANVKTPLSRAELLEALSIRAGAKRLDANDIIPTDRQFITMCADLVEVDKENRYNLIHSSLREYLVNLGLSDSPELEEYWNRQIVAECILCEACLTYLLFEKFQSGPAATRKQMLKLQEANPFLEYAGKNWGHHISEITDDTPLQLIWDLLGSKSAKSLALQILLKDDADFKDQVFPFPDTHPSALHALASFGLSNVAALSPELEEFLHQKDGFNCLPLDYALLFNKERDMCMWLLRAESKVEGRGAAPLGRYSPLHMAAESQWTDVVDQLIANGYSLSVYMSSNGQTPLAYTALKGHLWAVEKFLEANADVEARDEDQATPLILAAEANHEGIVSALLAAHANVDAQNNIGATALHYATSNGNVRAVNILLDFGANIQQTNSDKEYSRTPTHLAARKNPPDMIRALHARGADLNAKGSTGYCPLHMAIGNKALETAQALIDLGANPNAMTNDNETLLHVAALYGDEECIKFVLAATSNAFLEASEALGDTALNLAAFKGQTSACEMLLEQGVLVDVPNNSKLTALLQAINEGHLEASKLLLRYKANPMLRDSIDSTALHCAALKNLGDLIPLLIDAGADPDARNVNDDTALHVACKEGNTEFVQQLLLAVPTLDAHPRCQYGRTPLHVACERGDLEAAKMLLQRGMPCITDNDSNLPLHRAAACGHDELVKLLLAHMDVNAHGYLGQTPLKMAAARGHEQIVATLLDSGASIDLCSNDGTTPLIIAVQARHSAVADLLRNRGADVRAKTELGFSLVHAAALTGNCELLDKLIALGCDCRAATSFGATPFYFAVESGNYDTVNLLLSYGIDGSKDKTIDNVTCVHRAVEVGNGHILEKLVELGADVALTDSYGRTPLSIASWKGRHECTERLLQLNAPVDGSDTACIKSPLGEAARKGFLRIVAKLLEHNADVDKTQMHSNMTALMEAAIARRAETVLRLIEAGADPYKQDFCGNTALDYAYGHQPTLAAMGIAGLDYKPLDRFARGKLARTSACALLENVLSSGPVTSLPLQVRRFMDLSALASILLHMDDDHGAEAAKFITFEIVFAPSKNNISMNYTCDLCHQLASTTEMWACQTCFDTQMCSGCYKNYLAGGKQQQKCCPEAIRELEALEDHVSMCATTYDLVTGIFTWDLNFVASSLSYLSEEWINAKLKEYTAWEAKHADSSYVAARKRPGQELLKLHAEALGLSKADADFDPDDPDSVLLKNSRWAALERKATDFQRDNPIQDPNTFLCVGHDYLCISKAEYGKVKEDGTIFGPDGRICDEWMRSLLQRYKDADEHGIEAQGESELPTPNFNSEWIDIGESLAPPAADDGLDMRAIISEVKRHT